MAPFTLEEAYWLSQIGVLVVAAAGAVFAGYQLREIRRSNQRQADLAKATFLFDLDKLWESTQFAGARVAFEKLRADTEEHLRGHNGDQHLSKEDRLTLEFSKRLYELKSQEMNGYTSLMSLCGFFETAGMLVDKGYVNLRDVDSLYGGTVLRLHETFAKHIEKRAEEFPPGYLENFLLLAKRIGAIRSKR